MWPSAEMMGSFIGAPPSSHRATHYTRFVLVTRIYSGDDGESHFEDVEIPLRDLGEIGKLSALVNATGVIFRETELAGAFVIDLEPHTDARGFFARSFCRDEFSKQGLVDVWVQSNVSYNAGRGTLRGMHWQVEPHAEVKLVRCSAGGLYDVIVDLRSGSPSLGAWVGVELSAANHRMLYVPAGFAHGFVTLADDTEVFYEMSHPYAAGSARGFRFDDSRIGIDWPESAAVISDADAGYSALPDDLSGLLTDEGTA